MEIPCDEFVEGGAGPSAGERHCKACGWTEGAHDGETRLVMLGEHPESIPNGRGGFMRRPRFGAPVIGGRYA